MAPCDAKAMMRAKAAKTRAIRFGGGGGGGGGNTTTTSGAYQAGPGVTSGGGPWVTSGGGEGESFVLGSVVSSGVGVASQVVAAATRS